MGRRAESKRASKRDFEVFMRSHWAENFSSLLRSLKISEKSCKFWPFWNNVLKICKFLFEDFFYFFKTCWKWKRKPIVFTRFLFWAMRYFQLVKYYILWCFQNLKEPSRASWNLSALFRLWSQEPRRHFYPHPPPSLVYTNPHTTELHHKIKCSTVVTTPTSCWKLSNRF